MEHRQIERMIAALEADSDRWLGHATPRTGAEVVQHLGAIRAVLATHVEREERLLLPLLGDPTETHALMARGAPPLHDPIDPAVAAARLADWGFVAHADLPDGAGDAYLLVALRDRPTYRHFDPERIDLWVTRSGRGTRLQIDRSTPDLDLPFSWGTVAIVDRLGISNEYVVFGGRLTSSHVDGMIVVHLRVAGADPSTGRSFARLGRGRRRPRRPSSAG